MKRLKTKLAISITATMLLLVLCALLVYERFFPLPKAPVGIWVYSEDASKSAGSLFGEWMGGRDLSDALEPVYVNVILRVGNDGTFDRSVDKESYENARNTLYENCALLLKEGISAHLEELGMANEGPITDEEAEELINETVSTDSVAYLQKALPDLVPTYEEYVKKYGNKGTYTVDKNMIAFGSSEAVKFLFDKDDLLLGEILYRRYEKKDEGGTK
ncbi:MAG: hypothetical protein K6A38_02650 [Lachnospiraceae bacterium]|nr:hypothetical protein [Lachnospiraceae bacterium]